MFYILLHCFYVKCIFTSHSSVKCSKMVGQFGLYEIQIVNAK